jgi:hypothetical protein
MGGRFVATSHDDLEFESLILELGASLIPPQRRAFEAAARAALAATSCSGCGAAYRVLGPLQRAFFDPPSDARAISGARHHQTSKLTDGPPIGASDPREGGRERRKFQTVG